MKNWISTEERLPENNEWVLIHWRGGNWNEQHTLYVEIAKFKKGISMKERKLMINGELEDPDTGTDWNHPDKKHFKRSELFNLEDEIKDSENMKLYSWQISDNHKLCGQEVTYWCGIPKFDFIEK